MWVDPLRILLPLIECSSHEKGSPCGGRFTTEHMPEEISDEPEMDNPVDDGCRDRVGVGELGVNPHVGHKVQGNSLKLMCKGERRFNATSGQRLDPTCQLRRPITFARSRTQCSFRLASWKNLLFASLHVHGPDGVKFYTRTKVITSRWPDRSDAVSLAIPTVE